MRSQKNSVETCNIVFLSENLIIRILKMLKMIKMLKILKMNRRSRPAILLCVGKKKMKGGTRERENIRDYRATIKKDS